MKPFANNSAEIKPTKFYTYFVIALIISAGLLVTHELLKFNSHYQSFFPDPGIINQQYPIAQKKVANKIYYQFAKHPPSYWLTLKLIPKHTVAAILISEDSGFYQHHGYSIEAIKMAWQYNHDHQKQTQRGGSTITQQVVKNLFLTHDRTVIRKMRELLLAVEIERKVSKAKILETYFNIVEWGPNVFGLEQASQYHFHKPATELNAKESAMLAFLLPNPVRLQNSIKNGELSSYAQKRVGTILYRMFKTGHISPEEYIAYGIQGFSENDIEEKEDSDNNEDDNTESELPSEQKKSLINSLDTLPSKDETGPARESETESQENLQKPQDQ